MVPSDSDWGRLTFIYRVGSLHQSQNRNLDSDNPWLCTCRMEVTFCLASTLIIFISRKFHLWNPSLINDVYSLRHLYPTWSLAISVVMMFVWCCVMIKDTRIYKQFHGGGSSSRILVAFSFSYREIPICIMMFKLVRMMTIKRLLKHFYDPLAIPPIFCKNIPRGVYWKATPPLHS